MPPRDLIVRTGAFALEVLEFCRTLPSTDEARDAVRQLRRAATSLRANSALLQEAIELSKIMATAYRTAKKNNARLKNLPSS